ncbi:MAG: hypothetical protein R3C56_33335 [Pirellulaceae bacterium]
MTAATGTFIIRIDIRVPTATTAAVARGIDLAATASLASEL